MRARGLNIVLPTTQAGAAALLCLAIWYAGVSQGNNAAFLLGFGVVSTIAVSLVYTWSNLHRVEFAFEAQRPAFAGQDGTLALEVINVGRQDAFALQITTAEDETTVDALPAGDTRRLRLRFTAQERGLQPIPDLHVHSRFPLGFFEARRRVRSSGELLIYPRPGGNPQFPESPGAYGAGPESRLREGDDFAGVRQYVPGESQRHIDWKAVARGAPLLTKQFSGGEDRHLHFSWETVSHLPFESRISQLTLWVIKAERDSRRYSLEIPGVSLPPSSGEEHFHRCLRALALLPREAER